MSELIQRKINYQQFFDNSTLKEIIDETLAKTSMNKSEPRYFYLPRPNRSYSE